MILIIDAILLVTLLVVWFNIERKWRTIYISQDPTTTYWNHIYAPPEEDASQKVQAAIDFHSNRFFGGTAKLGSGEYDIENSITLKRRVCLDAENKR